jgi:hypothetical protein
MRCSLELSPGTRQPVELALDRQRSTGGSNEHPQRLADLIERSDAGAALGEAQVLNNAIARYPPDRERAATPSAQIAKAQHERSDAAAKRGLSKHPVPLRLFNRDRVLQVHVVKPEIGAASSSCEIHECVVLL